MYIYCMYNPTISMYTSNGFAKARFKDAGDQEAVSFLMVKKNNCSVVDFALSE